MIIDPTKPGNYKLQCGDVVLGIYRYFGYYFIVYKNAEGFINGLHVNADGRSVMNDSTYDLIERQPYEDFKDGDRAYFSQGVTWHRGIFAGIDNGKLLSYEDGRDKWASFGRIEPWQYCRRPNKEEMEE